MVAKFVENMIIAELCYESRDYSAQSNKITTLL